MCEPQTCRELGAECGEIDDGCGTRVRCGGCSAPGETCGGAGVSNRCGSPAQVCRNRTTAWRDPSQATNGTGFGTLDWARLNAVFTSNGSGQDPAGRARVDLAPGQATRYLRANRYGFAIPEGATVRGIEARIERRGRPGPNLFDAAVRLMRRGSADSLNRASPQAWTMQDRYIEYGDSTDRWGLSWSPDEVNSPGFGLALAVRNRGDREDTPWVDHMQMRVHFRVCD